MSEGDFARHLQRSAQISQANQARARLTQLRADAEDQEAAVLFALIASRPEAGPPPDLRLTVPSGRRRSLPLQERRRRAHAAHLDEIIAAAVDGSQLPTQSQTSPVQPEPDGPVGTADQRLAGRLCGACGGGCCAAGGDFAYLNPDTIRRVMAASPGLDPAQLRTAYLQRLAPRTIWNSCIHHTREGCSLPRTLRSDTCNEFACLPLQRLQIGLDADPPVRKVVVLRRRQDHWNKTNPDLDNDVVGAAILTDVAAIRVPLPTTSAGTNGWTPAARRNSG